MKDPKEYFDKIPYDFRVPNAKEWICEQILNAQKDAYNEAIGDAAANVEMKSEPAGFLSYCDCPDWSIDLDSILKLKIK